MDFQTLFLSAYEVALSLVFGLLTVFIVIKLVERTFLEREEGKTSNLATSIFTGSTVLCVLLLVQSAVLPSVDAMRAMVLGHSAITASVVAISFGYFLAFYAISLMIGLAVIFLAIQIYMVATTDVDELAELRSNNVGVAVVLAAVLLGTTLFVRPPVERFIGSLVDYDALEAEPTVVPRAMPEAEDVMIAPTMKTAD